MIGTRMRGFHHLFRVMKTLKKANLFFSDNSISIYYGTALFVENSKVKNCFTSKSCDYLMLFNRVVSNVKFNPGHYIANENAKDIIDLWKKYGNVYVICDNHGVASFDPYETIFSSATLLPVDFENQFNSFCEANKKQFSGLAKFNEPNSPYFKYFFSITNGSKNFFFWAVNSFYKGKTSIDVIEKIMIWNEGYSQLSKNLKKGTITAYTSATDFINIIRELHNLRRGKRANDVINMFNTAQKKALRQVELTDKHYEILSKFGKLSTKKKINFIKKMSTVEDVSEILRQMSFLADIHFEWKKESLLDFIKNSDNFNCEIVSDKGNTVLLKVNDYETVKRLAKTTNWCISKDKKYWNEYVERKPNSTQYVIFDFSRKEDDKLSIVGFTSIHDVGITNAHDFENTNLMFSCEPTPKLTAFADYMQNKRNIYNVLSCNGINLSDVVTYEPLRYEWNKESLINYLNKCVDEDEYYILCDENNKLAIIVDSPNIKYFFGDGYANKIGQEESQHIIFADFNKSSKDPNKLLFGFITNNYDEHESSCSMLFNERLNTTGISFDSIIEEYGLPYDIICRTDNVVERFYNALSNYDMATLNNLIKDKKVISSLKSYEKSVVIYERISSACLTYNSFDYLDLFYNNGFLLTDLINETRAGELMRRILLSIFDLVNHSIKEMKVPSEKDVDDLLNGNVGDNERALYIGRFIMLMRIIEAERNHVAYLGLMSLIRDINSGCDLFDLIITRICDLLDIKNDVNIKIFNMISSYIATTGSARVAKALLDKPNCTIKTYVCSNFKSNFKSTEYWVKKDGNKYELCYINEEAIAHAAKRR